MKKIIKIIFVAGIVILIIIQFFQPKKNESKDTSDAIFVNEKIPANIEIILKNSCFDCHSNHTRYLWFDKIAPASWLVEYHIREAKKQLNFSEWDKLSKRDKIRILDKIGHEVKNKDMPLESYTALHKSARMTEQQINEIVTWAEDLSNQLIISN